MLHNRTANFLLSAVALVAVSATPWRSLAAPAEIFSPYLAQIQQTLPPNWTMRLPSRISLGGPADEDFISQLKVRLFASQTPPGFTVALFSCDTAAQPCLVGSFAVADPTSVDAQRDYQLHRAAAHPIQLARRVRGYLREGTKQRPASPFSSVMWEQDGRLYTVSFLAQERQNLLNMASSMANTPPVYDAGGDRPIRPANFRSGTGSGADNRDPLLR